MIDRCALVADFQEMPNGDMTEVGEKGYSYDFFLKPNYAKY